MTMYGMMPEYGQKPKPWQKLYKAPLCHNYRDEMGDTFLLLVSMRFLRIASNMKGHYSLHRYYKRIKTFNKGFKK
jgi:uncharacterized protein YabN with tetrapyrrole methylase and pyrophosphatase domain